MRVVQTTDRDSFRRMSADELRSSFLLEDIFRPGRAELVYTPLDRAVVGGVVPLESPLPLEAGKEMASRFFCERREVGVINLGAAGAITVDGTPYRLATRECLYIGRGSQAVTFASDAPGRPSAFYLLSYPAHADHPTTRAGRDQANRLEIGAASEANRRTVFQYIRPGFIRSCQLVMGFTELAEGSVWNTFPPHLHARRTEVYCYFDLPKDGVVFHLMGRPEEARHVVVREKQAVLSPEWSIHSGVGSGAYRFVWGMGGENQVFEDMDPVEAARMK